MQQYNEESIQGTMQAAGGQQKSTQGFTEHSPAQLVPQTRASDHKSISGHRVAVPVMFKRLLDGHSLRTEESRSRSQQGSPCQQTKIDRDVSLWDYTAK